MSLLSGKKDSFYIRGYWPYLLITLSVMLLYARTWWYGFSPMDERWIIFAEKENLSHFSNLPKLFSTSTLGMYYRPMLSVTLMTDMITGGGSAFSFHFTNVLLHLASSLLLFVFLTRLNIERTVAFFGTLIFVVHPVNIHAVAWIPGRNDMLLAPFVLLSSIFVLQYIREQKILSFILHLLFFAFALFTKESAIVLPAVFLLTWLFYSERNGFRRLLVPGICWCAITVVWFYIHLRVVNYIPPETSLTSGSFAGRFFSSLLLHTGKAILPVQQSLMPMLGSVSLLPFAIALVLISMLFVMFGVQNRKTALFGLAWFILLLILPAWYGASNGSGEHYEHRDYTPLPGLIILLSQLNIRFSPRLIRGMATLIILGFAVKTSLRMPVYADEFSYSRAGADEAPPVALFHDFLGAEYMKRNDPAHALVSFNKAIALDSGNADFFSERARAELDLHQFAAAIRDADRALWIDHTLKEIHRTRGESFFYLGNFPEARKDLDTAKWLGVELPPGIEDAVNDSLKQ